MPLTLPETDDTVLASSPLEVVVCQVRTEQNLVLSDGDTGLKIHEDLGGREIYPWIEPQQTLAAQVELGPGGLTSVGGAGLPSRGWRLKSGDGTWIVSLMPDFVGLETTAYTTWRGEFRERMLALIAAVTKHISPSIEQRVGLRYVNRIVEPDRKSPQDWIGIIANELLGPVADSFWSSGISNYQQQLDLDVGNEERCLVRHGFIPLQSGDVGGYVLDFDVYRQMPRRFDDSEISASLDRFNRIALALFHRSLADEYLSSLRTR